MSRCGCAMSQAQCGTCECNSTINIAHKESAEQELAILSADWEVVKSADGEGCIEEDMVVIGNGDSKSEFNEFVDKPEAKAGRTESAIRRIAGLKGVKAFKYFQGDKAPQKKNSGHA